MSALPKLRDDFVAAIARDNSRRRRRLQATVALILVVGAATAFIAPGSPTHPAQALAQAAQRTASFPSGRIVWTFTTGVLTATTTARYDGQDYASDTQLTLADGAAAIPRSGVRVVDGELYASSDGSHYVDTENRIDAAGGSPLSEQTQAIDALSQAARSAHDVTSETQDGTTQYTATVPGSTLAIPVSQGFGGTADGDQARRLAPYRITLGSSPFRLRVSVSDGTVRSFSVDGEHGLSIHAEIDGLGRPQRISVP